MGVVFGSRGNFMVDEALWREARGNGEEMLILCEKGDNGGVGIRRWGKWWCGGWGALGGWEGIVDKWLACVASLEGCGGGGGGGGSDQALKRIGCAMNLKDHGFVFEMPTYKPKGF